MPKKESGKSVILGYLKQRVGEWISNTDLRAAAHSKGLMWTNDVPRTIRLLRQEGWRIHVRGDGYVKLTSLEKAPARGIRITITQKLRYAVLSRDGFRCKACGRTIEDGVRLVVDHVIPVDWGGISEISNLQTLCEECNHGKQAWVAGVPSEAMSEIMSKPTVEKRIEALFDRYPNQDIDSTMIQLVSRGAFDWQRALRRVRQTTGKQIMALRGKNAYKYVKQG